MIDANFVDGKLLRNEAELNEALKMRTNDGTASAAPLRRYA